MFSRIHQQGINQQQAGYSLLEITVVVFILGVMAYVVAPDFSATSQQKLDLAASEVAQAIRTARNESMRTGEVHGITVNQDTQTITLKKYNMTTTPIVSAGTIYHPVDKKPYQFSLKTGSLSANIEISNSQDVFLFSDGLRRKSVLFNASGSPFWYIASSTSTYPLSKGVVQLSYGGLDRIIILEAINGRVSWQ